jgi:hypothetical protein
LVLKQNKIPAESVLHSSMCVEQCTAIPFLGSLNIHIGL